MSDLELERHIVDEAPVAIVTLNRPSRLNTISREMLDALQALALAFAHDTQTRVLVITGAGERAFCAGADVTPFLGMSAVEAADLMAYGQRVFAQIEDLPQPVIAAINGYALGGGLELALACDFRLAAAGAKLGQPEITLANLPGWGGTQRLPRLIGEAMAKDLILTGRIVHASEALSLHLVHELCPDGSAVDAALRLAGRLAQHAPTALAMAKRAIHAARRGDDAGYAVESEAVGLCFTTPEQQAAIRAFLEKRQAKNRV